MIRINFELRTETGNFLENVSLDVEVMPRIGENLTVGRLGNFVITRINYYFPQDQDSKCHSYSGVAKRVV